MRNMSAMLVIVAMFALTIWTAPATSQEKQEMSPEAKAEMEAWQKAATPNENHQRLARFEGTWSFTSRWWSAPGAEPMESTGSATYEMILGGRYLKEIVKSEWMDESFEGLGYTGYDNVKKVYVSTWFDNMSTGMMISEGSWDGGSNTFNWTGEYMDAMTGKLKKMRMVNRIEGSDKHVAEFYDTGPDGKEYKSMELIYTRK